MNGRESRFLERLPLTRARRWQGYAAALAFSLIGLLARWLLADVFPPGFPFITFFPAVILAAFLFGRGPGVFAAMLCGLLAWRFFITPGVSFVLGRGDVLALGFYGAVVTVIILVIDSMQRGNARLRHERERCEMLAERSQLLFSELQHRMSNNLQMVGAVLTLQQRGITDPAARQALADAGTKLQTIGRIQRQLYAPSGAPQTLDRVLPDLARDLIDTAGRPGLTVTADVDPTVRLPPDAIIPVALIVAEAIANSIEHGFAGCDTGQITLRLLQTSDGIVLSVADDGAGPPADFSVADATSLGLKITRTLAVQLGGSFDLAPHPGGGAVATLRLPCTTD